MARTSRAAAMQPASSLVVLLPALRLFGDHLHLHLILSFIGCSAMDHHQLLSRAFCFTCQFFPFSIPVAEVVSHYIHTRRLTRFLRFCVESKALSISPCALWFSQPTDCHLPPARAAAPFFYYYGFKATVFCHIIFPLIDHTTGILSIDVVRDSCIHHCAFDQPTLLTLSIVL